MTARCPFCDAVHPVPPEPIGQRLECPCGATGLLCAPKTEPDTAVGLAEMGLSDTYADAIGDTVSIVWGKERWWARKL